MDQILIDSVQPESTNTNCISSPSHIDKVIRLDYLFSCRNSGPIAKENQLAPTSGRETWFHQVSSFHNSRGNHAIGTLDCWNVVPTVGRDYSTPNNQLIAPNVPNDTVPWCTVIQCKKSTLSWYQSQSIFHRTLAPYYRDIRDKWIMQYRAYHNPARPINHSVL